MYESSFSEASYVLRTARGSLTGTEVIDNPTQLPIYRRYTRIRYALPPTLQRRWKKPQPLPPDWIFSDGNDRPGNYRNFGAICPQLGFESESEAQNDLSEDCLFLNVWAPAGGERPAKGWPVQFVIYQFPNGDYGSGHGMQASFLDPVDMFRESGDSQRIVISPNFRVDVFGFLASEEFLPESCFGTKPDSYCAVGNFGLWDIRMALEWTHANIHLFGGNERNISVGGSGQLSALQLHYDAFQPFDKRIIRRAYLSSGAIAIQPDSAQSPKPSTQYNEVCKRFRIDDDLPNEDRVRLLRGVSAEKLLEFVRMMGMSFKPVTDGKEGFIPASLMKSIRSGQLGRRLKGQKVQVLLGDPSNEAALYWYWSQQTREYDRSYISSRHDLKSRLAMSYPQSVADSLVTRYEGHGKTWNAIYYQIRADVECHAAVRGFAQCLFRGGMTPQDILRYHINWRPKDLAMDPDTGISHVMDVPIWWFSGWRAGFSEKDKDNVAGLTEPFGRFLQGEVSPMFDWATTELNQVRMLDYDGSVRIVEDPIWEQQIETWALVRDAQLRREGNPMVKLRPDTGDWL